MRSYGQHCALARALDVIGDRWSLLIVRELLLGQERWSQLRDGLPGIAKNLLAERLRDLEQAGVLTHEGDRYELTERGRELQPAIAALLGWGAPFMAAGNEDDAFRPRWLGLAAETHPRLELVSLDNEHAVVRADGNELSGPPVEVMRELATLAADED